MQKPGYQWSSGVAVAAIAMLLLVGCTKPKPLLGVLQPLSGAAGVYGSSIDSGMQVALDEAKEGTALPPGFDLFTADTGSDPRQAVREFHRLVDEHKVTFVVGGVTADEAYALIPEVEQARVICLSPCVSATDIAKKSRFFFRISPTDEAEGQAAARHLYSARGARRLLIYTDGSSYTRGVESAFRQHYQLKHLGRILDTVHIDRTEWQRRSTDLIHAHHPEAVFIIGYAPRIVEVLQHLRDTGFEGIRCTTSAFFVDDIFNTYSDLADEVVFPLPSYYTAEENTLMLGFAEDFQERYNRKPDIFAAHGYDAMRTALRALAVAEHYFPSAIQQAMSFRLADLEGLTGTISFDDFGEVRRYPTMHIYAWGEVMPWAEYKRRILEKAFESAQRR